MSLADRLQAAFPRHLMAGFIHAGLSVSIEAWQPGGLLLLVRRGDVERVRAVLRETGPEGEMTEQEGHDLLIHYRDKYTPEIDTYQYANAQLERGIIVVSHRIDDHVGVVACGDRFSRNKREVFVVWEDLMSEFIDLSLINIEVGNQRRIYWPPGVYVGSRTRSMFRHLDRRWRSGR